MPKAKTTPRKRGTTGQFPTDEKDEKRLEAFMGREKARGLTLNRAQAIGLLFRRGLDAEKVPA
jgi:hypothetical protein